MIKSLVQTANGPQTLYSEGSKDIYVGNSGELMVIHCSEQQADTPLEFTIFAQGTWRSVAVTLEND